MAEKKAHEVDAWLARPDPNITIVLIYGPDRGLVAERARLFVSRSGIALDDAFSLVRLDASEIERDPGRLIDEAGTVSMFSERRLIWVRDAGAHKGFAEAVKALAATPLADAIVLIEAGDLKKGSALRSAAEAARAAIALPCYADDGRSIDAVIDDAMQKAGVSLGLEARQALKRNLGGDRLASRSEIEKLLLYAAGGEHDHPGRRTCRDGRRIEHDRRRGCRCGHAWQGRPNSTRRSLASSLRETSCFRCSTQPCGNSSRSMRCAAPWTRRDRSAAAVIASARPPVFFARRGTVETALSRWPRPSIAQALDRLQGAVLKSRQRAELAEPIVRQALFGLAVESSRLASGRASTGRN